MAGDAVQTRARATYEDLLRVPDTKVAEIVDGELVVSPRPALPHALAGSAILGDLFPAFHGIEAPHGPGGWWLLFEPELHFGDEKSLAYWARRLCEAANHTGRKPPLRGKKQSPALRSIARSRHE
jgi:hypothetical protein